MSNIYSKEAKELENAKRLGWSHKSDVARKYFPGVTGSYVTTLLRRYICDWHPIEYFLLYKHESPMYVSHRFFSKEQAELVDKIMRKDISEAAEYQRLKGYSDILVLKIAFAHDGLFPHLLPHVALERMELLLKRNYRIWDKVFPTEEDAASQSMTLKQAFVIARAMKSKQGVEWVKRTACDAVIERCM